MVVQRVKKFVSFFVIHMAGHATCCNKPKTDPIKYYKLALYHTLTRSTQRLTVLQMCLYHM